MPTDTESEDLLLVGMTSTPRLKFVREDAAGDQSLGLRTVTVEMERREWDVTDPAARNAAARALLGDLEGLSPTPSDYGVRRRHCAQWFINADRNTAALCVYRPSAFETATA